MKEQTDLTIHERSWHLTSSSSSFCVNYHTDRDQFNFATDSRLKSIGQVHDTRNPWGDIYNLLVREKESIAFLVDSLSAIAANRQLQGYELSEMIVTMVQDIPYSFVIPGKCETYETEGRPCVGDVRWGLYSPYEFLHTEMGDCDTRAVLVYAVLEEFGFDPAILVSDEYSHAMIALSIPTAGDYLLHQGKKYYFWETTAKGWMAGMLPPSYNNIDYWKIVLAHEL